MSYKAIVAQFNVLFQNMIRETEENEEKSQSVQLVARQIIKPKISRTADSVNSSGNDVQSMVTYVSSSY